MKIQKYFSGKTLLLSLTVAMLSFTAPAMADQTSGGWTTTEAEGIHLTYPATWKKTAIGGSSDDKDNLLKVSGTLPGGGFAELSLTNPKGELSPSLLLKILEEGYFSKLPEYKASPEKSVRLSDGQTALSREVTFRQAGALFCQRHLLFQNNNAGAENKNHMLLLTCPLTDYNATGTIWSTAVASLLPRPGVAKTSRLGQPVTSKSGSQSPSQSAKEAGTATKPLNASTWSSQDGELSLSLPGYLKETVSESDDHPLKAVSAENGKMICVDVYRGDADNYHTLPQLCQMLEEKYFETQKGYRKLNEEARSMGQGGSLSGIARESTFVMNGTNVHHLSGYIMSDKHLYAIGLTTAGVNNNEAHQIWSRVLSSVALKK
ncbi:MAG: DcrB-related protein [Candidatus Melainabacteria bacterium]|nr:DcrB-related protein [Candidatus Melainabacteria bacterium]